MNAIEMGKTARSWSTPAARWATVRRNFFGLRLHSFEKKIVILFGDFGPQPFDVAVGE